MFDSLMYAYKNMNISDKKNALMNEVKKTVVILKKTCDDKGIRYREINSKEILDFKNGVESNEDYLESMFVYIMYLEELLWSYVEYTDK